MRTLLLACLVLAFAGLVSAQPSSPGVAFVTVTPSGACSPNSQPLQYVISGAQTGNLYGCDTTWQLLAIAGGGSPVVPGGSPGDVQCNIASAFGPCKTGVVTVDSSGNFSALSFSAGSGTGIAGAIDIGQGTLPALGTNAVSLLGPTSVTSYGLLFPGSAPSANQFLLYGTPSSGISTGVFTAFTSTNLTDTANLVRNQGANTGSSAMTLDMSASSGASAFKVPVGAGLTVAVNGAVGYDSTADMLHAAQGSADAKIPQFTVIPVNGDCANWVVSGSKYKLGTAGSPCGSGGGGSGNSVTSVTPVTVAANSTSEQQLMELTLTAGYLNSLRQPFLFNGAGVYTTPIGQTPTLTFKVKLCTVSGCGSGTVVTLASITSTATLANSTNNTWNVSFLGYTAATGATGNLEVHGPLTVDLGSLSTSPDSVFNDTNTAVSGNIDLTAALFVDFTVTTSTGSTSNSITQRSGGVMPFAATAAPVTSVNGLTGAVVLASTNLTDSVNLVRSNTSSAVISLVNSNWTTIGAGGTRTNTSNNGPTGGATIAITSATGGSGSIYGVEAPISGDFTRYIQIWCTGLLSIANTTCGAGFTDGTKVENAQLIFISAAAGFYSGKTTALAAGTYTAANGDENNLVSTGVTFWNNIVFFKLNRTGTTYTGSYSLDGGANYIPVFSDTSPFLTATNIIVFGDARGGTNAAQLTLISCSDGAGSAC